jgi:2-polyprenyl-3-methyl-5-hydroxy-6-metoxy-1,4-benzoquinol methylase
MKDKMTWEETIKYIRTQPEYISLVDKAYFEEDLPLNIERFKHSEEYIETLNLLKKYRPDASKLLDVGSGNGISAVSFALDGYQVTATEPDPSNTIGAGAIRKLKSHYNLSNLEIFEEFAEKINHGEDLFDVIYVRQAMHHAYDLDKFISNLASLLKKGALLITVRDHVIYNEEDKKWFLENHPLHNFYGGENAFTETQYREAFTKADLNIELMLKHYDSVINYFPLSIKEFENGAIEYEKAIKRKLIEKLGLLGRFPITELLYKKKIGFNKATYYNETKIPGRIYSFITIKN